MWPACSAWPRRRRCAGASRLLLVGVRPHRQNAGLGRALVEHHHEQVSTGLPTSLEATTLESRRPYSRLGYADTVVIMGR